MPVMILKKYNLLVTYPNLDNTPLHVIGSLSNKQGNGSNFWTPKFLRANADFWLSLLVAIFVIGFGIFLGWSNYRVVTPAPSPGYHYVAEPHNPLSFMASWDAPNYLYIARHGYTSEMWTNWFPLYPLLINAANHLVPSPLDSALLIAWASLVGAIYFYIKIARLLFGITDEFEPLRAVIFFVLFPTAVFLIAPFTESLFSLLALGAIYFALKKQWLFSALLTMLCTATHITGPFVVVLIALILLEQKTHIQYVLLASAIGSLGLLDYMLYLYLRFHNPIAYIQTQVAKHGWDQSHYLTLLTSTTFTTGLLITLILLSAIYWWPRKKSFAVYSLLYPAVPLAGKQYGGFDRYVLMAFPIQFMLYGYFRDKKKSYAFVTAILGIMWTYFLLQYAGGYIGS